jgi:CRISPR-associated endonuclease/helicase Cas3
MSLSATGRPREGSVFRLEERDIEGDEVASDRLNARKLMEIVTLDESEMKNESERLATIAWALTNDGTNPLRCLVFCNRRETALKTAQQLEKRGREKTAGPHAQVELFVGARRGFERQAAAAKLSSLGFIAAVRHRHGSSAGGLRRASEQGPATISCRPNNSAEQRVMVQLYSPQVLSRHVWRSSISLHFHPSGDAPMVSWGPTNLAS